MEQLGFVLQQIEKLKELLIAWGSTGRHGWWAVGVIVALLLVALFLAMRSRRSASIEGAGSQDQGSTPIAEQEGVQREAAPAAAPIGSGDEPRPPGPQGGVSTGSTVWAEKEVPAEPFQEEPEDRFWEKLRGRLSRTHDQFVGRVETLLSRKRVVDQEVLEELEEIMLTADLGVKTAYHLLAGLQKEMSRHRLTPDQLKATLREEIETLLQLKAGTLDPDRAKPFVILVVGVNGVGKTTTIGKLAARLAEGGRRKVMLVAADTFRPAAIEQLAVWSDRVGSDFVRHQIGADPSAVVYDAIHAAASRGSDVVLVDTAGRLHTRTNLIEELKKIKRTMGKELDGAPHEVLLVLDATTGQNAIHQAKTFHESIGVTGLVLTKLDGTAKGGIIVGIVHELQLPVRFIGIGEQIGDLREFHPDVFAEALFSEGQRPLTP